MGALITICPETGRKIEIGVETDKTSMERTQPFITEVTCPFCRATHAVTKADLLVCEIVDGVVSYQRAA